MAATIEEQRWNAEPDQLAAVLRVEDAPRFFLNKKLIIEPGTRALIIDDGQFLGEVGPGSYTIETFAEGLMFWRRKQASVVLTKQEDLVVDVSCQQIPTAENLLVDATVRLAVQIDDVALFTKNLLGTRQEFRLKDMQQMLLPLVRQALWEAIGRLSITDLTGAEMREQVDAAVEQALGVSIRRYGLRFVQVQLVSVRHEKYDEHRQKMGEAWLLREGLAHTEALNNLYSEEELLRIKRLERDNELALLAENVGIDQKEGELAAELRRIELRNQLRAAVQSEDFDKINSEEDMKNFLLERDKGHLLRVEERNELVAGFNERKEDRRSAREHLVAKLNLERSMEIQQVREQLDYAMKLKGIEHEIELTKMTACKENVEWQNELEKERREAEHRRQERDKQLKQQRQWTRDEAGEQREQNWEDLVHRQRMDRLEGDIHVTQTERQARIARLESELKTSLESEQLERDKRHQEWELEIGDRQSKSQIEKLAAVQELNAKQARVAIELDQMREDKVHSRELARLEMMKGMSAEALVATSGQANAALLADLKKHEATQQAVVAQSSNLRDKEFQDERAKLQQKLTDAERSKADAIAAAFQQAMQSHQQTTEKALDALGRPQMTPESGQAGQPPTPTGQQPGRRVVVCSSCRAENPDNTRFCSSCGGQL